MKQEDFKVLQINVANKMYCICTIVAAAAKTNKKTGSNDDGEDM